MKGALQGGLACDLQRSIGRFSHPIELTSPTQGLYGVFGRAAAVFRAHSQRTLLHAGLQSSARLEVTQRELRVVIDRQFSPHRTAALAALCEQLDALAIPLPGTHLRPRLAVEAEKPIML